MPVSVRADADPDLRWSARHGVSLGGTAGLDVVVPIEKSLGPVTVDSLHLGLTGGDGQRDASWRRSRAACRCRRSTSW